MTRGGNSSLLSKFVIKALSVFDTMSKEATGMKKIYALIIPVFLVVSLPSLQGCATEPISFKIENSLPQSKLAYYNDSFDKIREDVWEKAAFTKGREQIASYRRADVTIEEGQLSIKTKTGGFSQGGLGSKYVLRGDFDVQLDCHIDFSKGKRDFDQYLFFFVAVAETKTKEDRSVAHIGVVKKAGHGKGLIYSRHTVRGERFPFSRGPRIGRFHGSFRIVRTGERMGMFFRKEREALWRELGNFAFPADDVRLGFSLQNYIFERESIIATSYLMATFDNFRINAAQEIIEEDI
jgi:hypothetical protein